MMLSGILMDMIASSFGVGGGFMFMPFMTSVMGYQPDGLMAAAIAAGAILGGMVGPRIQKHLAEIFLKRMLALALVITFMDYAEVLVFLR